MHLLDLPEELLERIGLLLATRDVLVFERVSCLSFPEVRDLGFLGSSDGVVKWYKGWKLR
jgi:hypothetical protein